jgi:hypothetical protein
LRRSRKLKPSPENAWLHLDCRSKLDHPSGSFPPSFISSSFCKITVRVFAVYHIITMATSHGEGYAQIAWRMSRHPDLAIVRRFRAMNLQNILYLQAELNELEDTLKQQEEIDRSSSNEQQRWNAPVVDRYGPWVRAHGPGRAGFFTRPELPARVACA